jgi:acyl-CoA synthetase (AMP-forming)/AMP-acid ligase II
VLTEQNVLDCLRNRIARFKIPRRVFFVDAFPMTGSGKIQKYLLREQAQKGVSG